MWPVPVVSAAMISPCAPPYTYASSDDSGSVMCANPERKATYLRIGVRAWEFGEL